MSPEFIEVVSAANRKQDLEIEYLLDKQAPNAVPEKISRTFPARACEYGGKTHSVSVEACKASAIQGLGPRCLETAVLLHDETDAPQRCGASFALRAGIFGGVFGGVLGGLLVYALIGLVAAATFSGVIGSAWAGVFGGLICGVSAIVWATLLAGSVAALFGGVSPEVLAALRHHLPAFCLAAVCGGVASAGLTATGASMFPDMFVSVAVPGCLFGGVLGGTLVGVSGGVSVAVSIGSLDDTLADMPGAAFKSLLAAAPAGVMGCGLGWVLRGECGAAFGGALSALIVVAMVWASVEADGDDVPASDAPDAGAMVIAVQDANPGVVSGGTVPAILPAPAQDVV